MSRSIRCLLILCACFLTTACASLTVPAPETTLPPIPPELLQPCPAPPPLTDGKIATLYLQMLEDAGREWECISRQAQLAAVVKYREQVAANLRNQSQNKPWWKFW